MSIVVVINKTNYACEIIIKKVEFDVGYKRATILEYNGERNSKIGVKLDFWSGFECVKAKVKAIFGPL